MAAWNSPFTFHTCKTGGNLKSRQRQGLLIPVYVLPSAEHRPWLFFFSMNCSLPFSLPKTTAIPKTITSPHFPPCCLLMGMISVIRNVSILSGYTKVSWLLADVPAGLATPQHFQIKLWWVLFPVFHSNIRAKLWDTSNCNSGGVASYTWCEVFLGK